MTSVNTGNFQSTRFKLRLGHSTLGNKGCIQPGKSSTTLGFIQQAVEQPASLLALGSHASAIGLLSSHVHSHPLVCGFSNFSFQPLLLLGQVVITVNCASVSLLLFSPCPASPSHSFSLLKG